MKEKLKNILLKKIFYVTLSLLIIGTIEIVYASNLINSKNVSYSNETSKLNSTNVQGAIDELYNNCKNVKEECPDRNICRKVNTFRDLKALEVTSGDGLYQDETEPNKYFYRGKSPNNYVKFNNELWRILNINQDGTAKIVKDGYYSTSMAWDTSGNNDWTRPATLNTQLNSMYYNSLSDTAQNMINTSTWNIGPISYSSNRTFKQDFTSESINNWSGKIALFTMTEYIRTNSNKNCFKSVYDNNIEKLYEICKTTTWLLDENYINAIATLSSSYEASPCIWAINAKNGDFGYVDSKLAYLIKPVLVLKSSVKIINGIGNKNSPFILE